MAPAAALPPAAEAQLLPVALPAMPQAAPQPAAAVDPAAAVWHYRTPKHGVQGPFSLDQLALLFRDALVRLNRWDTLPVWRTGQPEADAVLVASLLP
jgi:hypothetical protein